jgi:hypothetical protein
MLRQFAFSKVFFLLLLVAFGAASCTQGNEDKKLSTDVVGNNHGTPKMTFDETKFDFGKITEGEIVSHEFEFTNTGDGDLVISEAHASCGCTVPEFPKEPVKPGEKNKILVKFNSTGKEGREEKSIEISANTKEKNYIVIYADVVKPGGETK